MRACTLPLLILPFAALGCKTIATETREPARAASSEPSVTRAPAVADAGLAAAPAREDVMTPLAWGTRPPTPSTLYPVVDGMCIHGEIWPTKGGGALYSYGNGTGAWTRGDVATLARLVDDGLEPIAAPSTASATEAWSQLAPMAIEGAWPGPLFLYSLDGGGGRMRDWPTVWVHRAEGFELLASHRETGAPSYDRPTVFQGNLVTARRDEKNDGFGSAVFKAYPFEDGAKPVANLAALGRGNFVANQVATSETTLFAVGTIQKEGFPPVLRSLSAGAVKEVPLPQGLVRIITTKPSLVLSVDGARVLRLAGDKLVAVKLPSMPKLVAIAGAPTGDLWFLPENRKTVFVVHGDDKVDELPIPPSASPRAQEAVQHWPTSGSALAGLEVDDPYVIGETGSLYHLEQGKWAEVALPAPPFASTGKYQAQAVLVPAKGEVFVNAGYAEKGVGWKTPERYRAVLRNRRPKEVLRCNEPSGGSNSGSGNGFMSFPPIADDACTTPFVVLLRLGYDVTQKTATYIYERSSDYPSVREAIKATPSLGTTVDLVELVSGNQRYLGARVPSVAAGRELAQAVAKRVVGYAETRPEVVCGQPKEERVLHVDVATGKLAATLPSQR